MARSVEYLESGYDRADGIMFDAPVETNPKKDSQEGDQQVNQSSAPQEERRRI